MPPSLRPSGAADDGAELLSDTSSSFGAAWPEEDNTDGTAPPEALGPSAQDVRHVMSSLRPW
jgi:hypothetical protein